MAKTARIADEFIADLTQFIVDYNTAHGTNYDTRVGTVLKDIVIDSPAQEFAKLSGDLTYIAKTQSINYASEMDEGDLDDLAANYGLTRKSATYSTGSVYFIADAMPTSNIIINSGTIVSMPATDTTPEMQYQTIETVVLDYTNLPAYEFTENLVTKWRISAKIQASTAGSTGNAASGAINVLNQSVPGIARAKNALATTGGTDSESNESLGSRIQIKLTGNSVGTETGLISMIETDGRVEDTAVVGPSDTEMLRNEYGGSVDIYVLGSDLATANETQIYQASVGEILLIHKPVLSVSSVTGTVSGAPHIFTLTGPTPEAIFVKDSTIISDSAKEVSKIIFPTATVPDDGTEVTTVSTYDKLIEDLQIEVEKAENHILAADILIRRPTEITVNVYCEVIIYSGFISSEVAAEIKTNITGFIDTKLLGQSINTSDLISIIDGTDGVDSVDIPSFTPNTNIAVGKNQVAATGTITVKIGSLLF